MNNIIIFLSINYILRQSKVKIKGKKKYPLNIYKIGILQDL